jgi:hypothetical protein
MQHSVVKRHVNMIDSVTVRAFATYRRSAAAAAHIDYVAMMILIIVEILHSLNRCVGAVTVLK